MHSYRFNVYELTHGKITTIITKKLVIFVPLLQTLNNADN